MFHVEQFMKYLIFVVFTIFLNSCVQNIANPEQSDEIYKDYVVELGIVSKLLEEEQKNLKSILDDRAKIVPQTGQIKFSNKKVADAEEKINSFKQQKQYFEIKIDQRARFVKMRSAESLSHNGRPWPDEEELKLYKAVIKFNHDKLAWQASKGVKKSVPRGTEKTSSNGH